MWKLLFTITKHSVTCKISYRNLQDFFSHKVSKFLMKILAYKIRLHPSGSEKVKLDLKCSLDLLNNFKQEAQEALNGSPEFCLKLT